MKWIAMAALAAVLAGCPGVDREDSVLGQQAECVREDFVLKFWAEEGSFLVHSATARPESVQPTGGVAFAVEGEGTFTLENFSSKLATVRLEPGLENGDRPAFELAFEDAEFEHSEFQLFECDDPTLSLYPNSTLRLRVRRVCEGQGTVCVVVHINGGGPNKPKKQ